MAKKKVHDGGLKQMFPTLEKKELGDSPAKAQRRKDAKFGTSFFADSPLRLGAFAGDIPIPAGVA